MGLRDLVTGRSGCVAPGSSSSSSSNRLMSFVDAFIGYPPKSELKNELSAFPILLKASFQQFKPLSTIPGDENEIELEQGSIRSMKGTDFLNGHHRYACGKKIQNSILSVPELSGIEPHFQESAQVDSITSMNVMPKFDGPPEMDVFHPLHRSSFQQHDVLTDQSKECSQELGNQALDYMDRSYDGEMGCPQIKHAQLAKGQIGGTDITNMVVVAQPHMLEKMSAHDDHPKFQGINVVSDDELSGGWLAFLGIALSHLGSLSQPRFWDEPIKWHEQVIGHRVWIIVEGLQQRSGWLVKVEATRKTLCDALQDAAMLAVITMRQHFPLEFRGTPFTVLPMQPGRRSKLDYPAIDGVVEAATFMGINYGDVLTLQMERFASLRCERRGCQAFEAYALEKLQALEVAKKMLEVLPPTLENDRMIADLVEMGKMEDNFVLRDCGWSVFVSNKAQQQVEPSHREEKPPSTEASSPAVSVRARL